MGGKKWKEKAERVNGRDEEEGTEEDKSLKDR